MADGIAPAGLAYSGTRIGHARKPYDLAYMTAPVIGSLRHARKMYR